MFCQSVDGSFRITPESRAIRQLRSPDETSTAGLQNVALCLEYARSLPTVDVYAALSYAALRMNISENNLAFDDSLEGLRRGDFSRLDTLFQNKTSSPPQIVEWVDEGRFRGHDQELAEALTYACFNGRTEVAEYLLSRGVAPSGGAGTGLDAIHWAVNRGQLETVRLLIRHRVSLESRSMYGGTALGTSVWSAINEPRAGHLAIIEELLAAGARVQEAGYPTERDAIDALLRRYGAS